MTSGTLVLDILKRLRSFLAYLFFLFTLCICLVQMEAAILKYAALVSLKEHTEESESFRRMEFGEDGISQLLVFSKEFKTKPSVLTALMMAEHDFELQPKDFAELTKESFQKQLYQKQKYNKTAFENLEESYNKILADLKFFPIPKSLAEDKANVSFENSWMFERNYGGSRGHEGTDIIPKQNIRGYYPILSITDGIIENIGWLEQGGYRIGIRSAHGAYFYYAHLSGYAKNFEAGETVKAGEILGFMGDTGYSKTEGTTGKFDVHLHLGIYIKTQQIQELSINPYWILKYLEASKLNYS